jgi:putative spermidine/putrescine transport system ATP-binding protein
MIEFLEVSKKFGSVSAVCNASFTLAVGELLAILGPSGCGKTTLLRIAGGYERCDSGSVRIHGQDVTKMPPEKRNVGMVFQNYALFPHLSVLDNVEFGLRVRKVSRDARRERAAAALSLVGLEGVEKRKPAEISGGQQQRVALARALVIEPAVLLLDEPLANLDRNVRLRTRDELRSLQQRLRIPTIFVTHDQEEALAIADRIAIMDGGRIEQIGRALDLCLSPASPFVANFLGLPPAGSQP